MLSGAALLVAQLGLQNIRKLLTKGNTEVVNKIGQATYGTAEQFKKAMALAPITKLIEYVNKAKGNSTKG